MPNWDEDEHSYRGSPFLLLAASVHLRSATKRSRYVVSGGDVLPQRGRAVS
jgi:hypothetical protein